jgi:hypothetical protein
MLYLNAYNWVKNYLKYMLPSQLSHFRKYPNDLKPPIFDDLTELEVVDELCHQLEAF